MDNKQEEQIELVDYRSGTTGSRADVVRNYTEMIKKSENNIGKITSYGTLITEKFIEKLRERRRELADSLINSRVKIWGCPNKQG